MIRLIAQYRIKKESLNEVQAAIQKFVTAVKKEESNTKDEAYQITATSESEDEVESGFQMFGFPFVHDELNTSGVLVMANGMKSGGNSILVYFTCEDCSREVPRVEKAGGKVLKEKFSIGEYGFCSICMDTEGNTFGLHSIN